MITIDLGTIEEYDDFVNEFITHKGGVVRFEYSLKVVYEWEAKWKKPYIGSALTEPEAMDFYKMMALDPFEIQFLTYDIIVLLNNYIAEPQTATVFTTDESSKPSKLKKGKFDTAEEIYATMFEAGIPLEFENRNLSRLLTIIRVMSIRSQPEKKMNKQEVMKQNASLNAQRKAMLKTKG